MLKLDYDIFGIDDQLYGDHFIDIFQKALDLKSVISKQMFLNVNLFGEKAKNNNTYLWRTGFYVL